MRHLTLALLTALCCQQATAGLISIDAGSEIWNRTISYIPPIDQETVAISGFGTTSGNAADPYGSANTSATISGDASSASIAVNSTLSKINVGRNINNRVDVIFTLTQTANFFFNGTASGTSNDAEDRFTSSIQFINLQGGQLFEETEQSTGSANFSVDGLGIQTLGNSSGVIGPGFYQIRFTNSLIDVDGDAQGIADLTTNYDFTLNAVGVPEPGTVLILLMGLLALRIR